MSKTSSAIVFPCLRISKMPNDVLSQQKICEIENVIRAYIASEFATMCNPVYRGPNFTWPSFIDRCERMADLWVWQSAIKGKKSLVDEYVKKFSKQNASYLVQLATEVPLNETD